jgi:hypothetical protein
MRRIWRLAAVATVTLAACSAQPEAGRPSTAGTEQLILAAHEQRRVATLAAEVAALDSMMTADLTFTHANGVVDAKADFLGALQSGRLRYQSITDEERRTRVHGPAGVISGTCRLVVTASGQHIDIRVRFTELWVHEGGRWRMVLWHAAPASSPTRTS